MFNIQKKYESFGCYRFLSDMAQTIYIGSSKNIHRRLFSQHFKKGHLPKECYDSTAKIEIIKTKDYATALALEIYLIDKYIPKFNKKDKRKDIFNKTKFENQEYYENLERWKLYYTFREYDFNKIKMSEKQNRLALAVTFAMFIFVICYMWRGL